MAEAIVGLDDLKRKFDALGLEAREGRKIIRASFRQAANLMRDAARAKAPVLGGQLQRKIQTASARGKPGTIKFQVRSTVRAKPTSRNPQGFPYSAAVERGHGFPGTRSRQFGNGDRQDEFGTSQVPAHPFMRPAWNEKKEAVLSQLGEEIGKRLAQLAQES